MRRLSITFGLLLGASLLAGCGGHSGNNGIASASGGKAKASATPSPAPSVDRQQQMVEFARCMRAHGVNMDDPTVSGNGIQIRIPQGTTKEKADAATAACRQYLPNGGVPPTMSPEQLDQARRYAACMRQHGVDMPDPNPNGGGTILKGVNPQSPTFQAAQAACNSLRPSMGPR